MRMGLAEHPPAGGVEYVVVCLVGCLVGWALTREAQGLHGKGRGGVDEDAFMPAAASLLHGVQLLAVAAEHPPGGA